MKHCYQQITCSVFSLVVIFLVPVQLFADQSNQQKIDNLKSQISQIKKEILEKEKVRDSVNQKISEFDLDISKLSKEVRKIQSDEKQLTLSVSKLNSRQTELQRSLKNNKRQVAEMTKTFYVMGPQNYLKSLLNHEDPNKHGRVRTYYLYLHKALEQKQDAIYENMAELEKIEQSLLDSVAEKRELLKKIEQETVKIVEKKNQKESYLENLEKQIQGEKNQIERLSSDQVELEKLAKAIEELQAKSNISRSTGIAFAKRKGDLNWPVSGNVIQKFGRPRVGGDLKWRGVLIETEAGTEVHAVSDGQVVYSDWISGYGYVLIIDHERDYMSLYGHNQQLLKDVGDFVKEDDIVAEAGNSGRSGNPALYFEIRYKGKPINPAKWMAARSR